MTVYSPGGKPLGKVDREAPVLPPMHLVEVENLAVGTDQEIARDDEQPIGPPHRRPQQRFFRELVVPPHLQDHFGSGADRDRAAVLRHRLDHRPRRIDEAVEGAEAQRIGDLADGLQHDRVGAPLLQPIGAVGDQEMAVLFGEGSERAPARLRLLGGHEVLQRLGAIAFPLELRDQSACSLARKLLIANQIQPGDTPPLGLLLRKGGIAADHRLLHQRQQMPGHRAPRRRQRRDLPLVAGGVSR